MSRSLGPASLVFALVVGISLVAQQPPNTTSTPVTGGVQTVGPTGITPVKDTNTATQTPTSDTVNAGEIHLGAGDLVKVELYGAPELATEARISNSGDLSLPLIGQVHLAGLSLEGAQGAIAERYSKGGFINNPQVTLFVKEYATQGVAIFGEVQKPGIYALIGPHRLFDAISMAGGLTEKAGRIITVTHRDRPKEPVTVEFSRDPNKSVDSNIDLTPGDTILVSKAGVVYVVGDVGQPSGFLLDKNDSLTVLQAIALAQGVKPTAQLTHARLIRRGTNGAPVEVPINLRDILAAKAPDVQLQADDIVFVPSSMAKGAMRRSMEAIIQTAVGVAIFRP
jgi:polysaccharide biosynthesis/export protein